MLKRLSPTEAKELLMNGKAGHLGCVTEKGPYVVPVNYLFHEGHIYIHSVLGAKIHALRQNPQACLQTQAVRDIYHWRSAIAFDTYEEITDPHERAWFHHRILIGFPHLTPVESTAAALTQNDIVIFRIRISEITGVGEG
jgi:uncharacterized protein